MSRGGEGRWRGVAPAKVNLHLRVLAREEEGHHQIETVFQALELADSVELELKRPRRGGGAEPGGRGPPVELGLEGVAPGTLGPDEQNLAVRAARAYLAALGREGERGADRASGLRVRLVKRIPHGAGLGGGSSDAAAVLRGLDALHGHALGPARLAELGSRLGADVAFFTSDVPRALGWGRGDRLLPLAPLPPRPVVLAFPPEPISTPWAYRVLAEHRERHGLGAAPGTALPAGELADWDGAQRLARNDFEVALDPHRPELRELRERLVEEGAAPALLSGSGAAVFGVFEEGSAAEAAEASIRSAFVRIRTIRTRTRGGEAKGT